MLSYPQLFTRLSLWINRIEDAEVSVAESEEEMRLICRELIQTIKLTQRALSQVRDPETRVLIARLIHILLFDFIQDEFHCFKHLREVVAHLENETLVGLLNETEDVLGYIVAISEWDGSVRSDDFERLSLHIARLESIL